MTPRASVLDLERTFSDLKQRDDGDDSALIRMFGERHVLRWPGLLEEFRVVLLAEAGTGKTTEIREATRRLRDAGKPAFFIRIEHVMDDFEGAFEEGSFEAFEAWAASGAEGWLLLDSIDEARLREPRDFERAIRKIARHLRPVMARAHIVLTGRTSAWRPTTDLAMCAAQFPFDPQAAPRSGSEEKGVGPDPAPSAPASTAEPFRVVSLDDLGPAQIRTFAEGKGLEDADDLLKALERQDAWASAARPQDLAELIDFWRDHRRLGSRLELMQASVARRLTERDQDRAEARPLSLAQVRAGAQAVALASTMAHESAIRVPDGAEGGAGLPIKEILPEWDDRDCATLLDRPIFEPGIYGAVRFHHRSVREFLTAEWLHTRLVDEGSRRQIESLFFRGQYGLEVLVPSLRPILPWLVLMDQRILDKVMRLAPEVLFEGGDPSQLPREVRAQVLRQTCERLLQPAHGRSMMDRAAVQRFAGEDLTDVLATLLEQYGGNEDVAWLLLRLVSHGELKGARPQVKALALRASEHHTRLAALDALRVVGTAADLSEVRGAMLAQAGDLPRDWLGAMIEGLPRQADQLPWLLAALEVVPPKERFHADALGEALAGLIETLPQEALGALLAGMQSLLARPPVIERRHCEISQRFGWLADAAGQIVLRLITIRHPSALDLSALWVLRHLPLAAEFGDMAFKPLREALPDAVQGWPDLNHALFWYSVAEERAAGLVEKPERPLVEFRLVSIFGSFWRFGPDYFDQALRDINERSLLDDRLVALSLAYTLYVLQGRPAVLRRRLRTAAQSDSALTQQLDQFLNPPARGPNPYRRQQARWKEEAARREAERVRNEQEWKTYLAANLDMLRNPAELQTAGQAVHCLMYLQQHVRDDGKPTDRWSEGRWESLIADFGEAIAHAFRDGSARFWRTYKPMLRSEGAAANSTPHKVILGLSGLSVEARQDPTWAAGLSPEEAEVACRYALHELNGFPSWLPMLNAAHPAVVERIILQEIAWELTHADPAAASFYVLHDVAWSGQWIWNQLAMPLIRMLRKPPKNTETLRYLLTVIQGSELDDAVLAALAAEKARARHPAAFEPFWFAMWTGVDPAGAIPALASRVAQVPARADQTDFMISFANALLGGRHGGSRTRTAYRSIEHLKALYLLLHAYVRQSEDIERAGNGVYSPGPRDDAQDGRDALFGLIRETPGKAAFIALMEISLAHPAEGLRPWMAFHAKTKAEQDADLAAWSLQQVREFRAGLERTPANHRDLWDLAVDRLGDLKADLEDGDSSIASILQGVEGETEMRKYIGNWCRDRAAGRYLVPQEEELADRKRPDIRIHGHGFDGPVPVELKLADKWPGPALFERLEGQLCGDYLRDRRSSRGIFLLVYLGQKSSWALPDGSRAETLDALVEALHQRWLQISPQLAHVEDIAVIGIDLTRRAA